jgi:hypothetical protein
MAFISSCPKCQNQVLVPDGACQDAEVKCPLCSAEYSLGEILAAAPPALIIVHPGSVAAPAAAAASNGAEMLALQPAMEGDMFSSHRVEPAHHDVDPLSFVGDEMHLAPDGHHEPEHMAEPILFAAGPEPFAEAPAELSHAGVETAHDTAEGGAPWGGDWGGFKDESAPVEDRDAGLAEPELAEDLGEMENVDFAAITGKPVPGEAAGEPGKKKKRKRGRNPVIFVGGLVLSAFLALVCVCALAAVTGTKVDALPGWLQFNFLRRNAASKPTNQTGPTANEQKPVNAGASPAAAPAGTASGNAAQVPPAGTGQVIAEKAPAEGAAAAPKSGTSESGGGELAMIDPNKEGPKPGTSASKPDASAAKPAIPATPDAAKPEVPVKPDTSVPPEPDPFGTLPPVAPVKDKGKPEMKPSAAPAAKPDVPAVKPDAPASTEPDPFGSLPPVAPVKDKGKPETKPSAAPAAKPDMPAVKPDAPASTEPDPFGSLPPVAPVKDKGKPETKPATPAAKPDMPTVKPDAPASTEPDPFGSLPPVAPVKDKGKPEVPTVSKPDGAKPDAVKPENPVKPDTSPAAEPDPFGSLPPVAPVKDKGKPDVKPAEPPIKPDAPAAKPVLGGNPPKLSEVAPDTPAIGPEPKPEVTPKVTPEVKPAVKPDVKPDVKPEIKPDVPAVKADVMPAKPDAPKPPVLPVKETGKLESKPDVKPEVKAVVRPAGIGPLLAPSYAAADLDASLKAVSASAVDAKSYADWCKLADVVTYVNEAADSQRQSLRGLAGKVASNPQAVAAIAASATKQIAANATTGGIVLAGAVTALGEKNGLSGTVIRMEGMTGPVRIFSGHPLDVKVGQKVIVFGAFVAEPVKNLPHYAGTQKVVVWADFATVIP